MTISSERSMHTPTSISGRDDSRPSSREGQKPLPYDKIASHAAANSPELPLVQRTVGGLQRKSSKELGGIFGFSPTGSPERRSSSSERQGRLPENRLDEQSAQIRDDP